MKVQEMIDLLNNCQNKEAEVFLFNNHDDGIMMLKQVDDGYGGDMVTISSAPKEKTYEEVNARLIFLAKHGVFESINEAGEYSIQKIDSPEEFQDGLELDFTPPQLSSDSEAVKVFQSLKNIPIND